jgi:hypothetical protein
MTHLQAIEHEIQTLLDQIEGAGDEPAPPEVIESLKAAVAERGAKLDRMGALILRLESVAEACRAEAKNLTARAKAKENAAARVRALVRDVMIGYGRERMETDTLLFYLGPPSRSVVVLDPDALPDGLVDVVRRPRTAELRALLVGGAIINGAFLETGERRLTIRR